eukprot:2556842-Prymnesium_polylepis.1
MGSRLMAYLPAGFNAPFESWGWWRNVALAIFGLWLMERRRNRRMEREEEWSSFRDQLHGSFMDLS